MPYPSLMLEGARDSSPSRCFPHASRAIVHRRPGAASISVTQAFTHRAAATSMPGPAREVVPRQRAADEPVRDHRDRAGSAGRHGTHRRPRDRDPRLEFRHALAPGRGVVRREDVDLQRVVGAAAVDAEVALAQQGFGLHRRPGGGTDRLRGGERARVVARQDRRDARIGQAPGGPLGLRDAALAERRVGVLENAHGVERRLAVAHEMDFHGRRG